MKRVRTLSIVRYSAILSILPLGMFNFLLSSDHSVSDACSLAVQAVGYLSGLPMDYDVGDIVLNCNH